MMSQQPNIWRRALARGADERGSMMVALMAILIVTTAVVATMARLLHADLVISALPPTPHARAASLRRIIAAPGRA